MATFDPFHPVEHVYGDEDGGKDGDKDDSNGSGARGRVLTWNNVSAATGEQREHLAAVIVDMVHKHSDDHHIVYTTLVGRDATGELFAEATVLPFGDCVRITLGKDTFARGENGQNIQDNQQDARRVAVYLLASYLVLAYNISHEDALGMCDLVDQDAKN